MKLDIKKIFYLIFISIFIIFVFSYLIEYVDSQVNGKTYTNVNEFLYNLVKITYTPESKYCTKQFLYLAQYDYSPEKSANTIKAKNYCNTTVQRIQSLKIPEYIPENKKVQLFIIRNDYADIAEDYYNLINIYENYKKTDSKRIKDEYQYSKDFLMKTYDLPLKISNVRASYSLKWKIKNTYAKAYFAVKRKSFERYIDSTLL